MVRPTSQHYLRQTNEIFACRRDSGQYNVPCTVINCSLFVRPENLVFTTRGHSFSVDRLVN